MFNSITHTQAFVTDQDAALEFYVGKLGLEIGDDVDLGFMRWLTVQVPGDPDCQIILEVPGPPGHDEETAAQVRALMAKGALGAVAILRTEDCHKTYEELLAKGVEFTQAPVTRFYGTDCGLRDPFGNNIRISEPAEPGAPLPSPEEMAKQFAAG